MNTTDIGHIYINYFTWVNICQHKTGRKKLMSFLVPVDVISEELERHIRLKCLQEIFCNAKSENRQLCKSSVFIPECKTLRHKRWRMFLYITVFHSTRLQWSCHLYVPGSIVSGFDPQFCIVFMFTGIYILGLVFPSFGLIPMFPGSSVCIPLIWHKQHSLYRVPLTLQFRLFFFFFKQWSMTA